MDCKEQELSDIIADLKRLATGLPPFFTADLFHPMVALGFTFGVGFTLAGLLLYIDLPAHRS